MNAHEEENIEEESQSEQHSSSESQGDVIFLLKKLQEQLTFLERKVDILVNQSKERPSFNKERTFSKPPFRPTSSYGPSRHGGRPDSRTERSGPPRERSYESGNRAQGKPYGGSAGYAGKKKSFFPKSRDR